MKRLHLKLALAVLLVTVACNTNSVLSVHPTLSIATDPVDFGSQPVLEKVTRVIKFSNIGKGTLNYSASVSTDSSTPLPGSADAGSPPDGGGPADAGGASDAGGSADAGDTDAGTSTGQLDTSVFSLSLADGGALPVDGDGGTAQLVNGEEIDVTVTFEASHQGVYAGTFTVTSDDPKLPKVTIPLTAQATTAAAVTIDPAGCLDFGRVPEGQTLIRQINVTSVGSAPLKIEQMSITGPSAAAFGFLGSSSGGTIDVTTPPTTVPINLKFSPQPALPNTNGAFTASLLMSTNAPDNRSVEVCLKGSINRAPVAVAQITAPHAGQNIYAPGTTVTVDGSMSTDPDGDLPLHYLWTWIDKPEGTTATILPDPMAATVTVNTDIPGTYVLQLVVTDSATPPANSKPVRVNIIVATDDHLRVELIWDTPVGNLDLHMRPVGTMLNSDSDCFGYNPMPMNWGSVDPPQYLGDKLSGFGPDYVDYKAPADGKYQVTVVYYSAQGAMNLQPTATVRVYEFGTIRSELTRVMMKPGDTWDAAVIDWPTGVVTPGAAAP
jgi:hypothetical protein